MLNWQSSPGAARPRRWLSNAAIFNGGLDWLGHRRRGSQNMVLDGGKLDIRPKIFVQWHGDFFRFSLGTFRVWFGTARRRHCSSVGIMFSPLFPRSVGVLIVSGWRVERCLRRIFQDPVGFGFLVDLSGFSRLSWYVEFYKSLSAFSSPGW